MNPNFQKFGMETLYEDTYEMRISPLIRTPPMVPAT
jgi:hypothetical protein